MIQRFIRNQLVDEFDYLEWTIDYKSSNGNYGAVYYDGGDTPDRNDTNARHMNYQIVIEHNDFELAERTAYSVRDKIHGILNVQTKHFDRCIFVQYIYAESEPIRVGVIDDKMIYTLNFNALIYPDCCE
jgi:hypothetical protein